MPSASDFSVKSYPLLHRVQRDGGIKNLRFSELGPLATELRRSLIEIIPCTGGHLASNLGVVELTIALHYVLDSPRDVFLWDVGHQAYVHKMLTNRWQDFNCLRQREGLSGFPRRDESLHDHLNTGHAGTVISAGLGLELSRSLDDSYRENSHCPAKVLCIVGDASLTSGMAFEAMNHCGHQPNQLVVIMNDNKMSISPNVGAVSRILSRLTAGHSYVFIRDYFNRFIRSIPLLGSPVYRGLLRLKGIIKKALYRNNLFTEFGFKYIGPLDGHNIPMLIDILTRIRHLREPVFLHIRTQKGRGLKAAEEAPMKYHGLSPGPGTSMIPVVTFTESFSIALAKLAPVYTELVCISAAMTGSTGLTFFAEQYPERFFDVGIAEQHAVTLACGLALNGKLPLVAIYSTFMQRALDQLIHDISLMNLPVIFVCDRAGIVPGDGDTHQGIYDIAQFRCIIGLRLYSPATQQQLSSCLQFALEHSQFEIAAWRQRCKAGQHDFRSGPVILRLPKRSCPDIAGQPDITELRQLQFFAADYPIDFVPVKVLRVLLLCTGSLLPEALDAQKLVLTKAEKAKAAEEKKGTQNKNIVLDVLQICQLVPLPKQILIPYFKDDYHAICAIEDGVVQGGIGEELLRLSTTLPKPQVIHLRGVEGNVPQLGNYQQLLQDYGLDAVSLVAWIEQCTAAA